MASRASAEGYAQAQEGLAPAAKDGDGQLGDARNRIPMPDARANIIRLASEAARISHAGVFRRQGAAKGR